MKFVGDRYLRKEDPRLLTGSGRYVGDIALPGMLHVVLLRSPHAHARIRRVGPATTRGASSARWSWRARSRARWRWASAARCWKGSSTTRRTASGWPLRGHLLPTATDVPSMAIDHLETLSLLNPLGMKGVGESGALPVAAVLAEAIEEPSAPAGRVTCMPPGLARRLDLLPPS